MSERVQISFFWGMNCIVLRDILAAVSIVSFQIHDTWSSRELASDFS